MTKIKIDNNTVIPMPVVLVGTHYNGQSNFMATGWVSRVNYQPPMLALGVNPNHCTAEAIKENGVFSVCIPGTDLIEKTDYCGMVSGKAEDKSKLFTVFYGESPAAPMITECQVCMECRLQHMVELPTNILFIGEIVSAFGEESCMDNGSPDIIKMKPFFLSMPDNNYWRLGETCGKAWQIGRSVKDAR